ncbi:hypothetical protein SBA2_450124 [Acidobacteriia bacterium SbA2]|nr:hypothetical protein SBA2_450124 [Acidobacteriia bacterium SbA2]
MSMADTFRIPVALAYAAEVI